MGLPIYTRSRRKMFAVWAIAPVRLTSSRAVWKRSGRLGLDLPTRRARLFHSRIKDGSVYAKTSRSTVKTVSRVRVPGLQLRTTRRPGPRGELPQNAERSRGPCRRGRNGPRRAERGPVRGEPRSAVRTALNRTCTRSSQAGIGHRGTHPESLVPPGSSTPAFPPRGRRFGKRLHRR